MYALLGFICSPSCFSSLVQCLSNVNNCDGMHECVCTCNREKGCDDTKGHKNKKGERDSCSAVQYGMLVLRCIYMYLCIKHGLVCVYWTICITRTLQQNLAHVNQGDECDIIHARKSSITIRIQECNKVLTSLIIMRKHFSFNYTCTRHAT